MKPHSFSTNRKLAAAVMAVSLAGCTAKAPSPAGETLLQQVRQVNELVGDHINHLDVAELMVSAGRVRDPFPAVSAAFADMPAAAEKLEAPARGTPDEAAATAIAVDLRAVPQALKSRKRSIADLRADCTALQERLALLEQQLISR